MCDGDSNGVLYFAGTSYGEHQWVNPVLAKVSSSASLSSVFLSFLFFFVMFFFSLLLSSSLQQTITITASSPHSRYTDPKVLVSRTYQVCRIIVCNWSLNEFLRDGTWALFACHREHLLQGLDWKMDIIVPGGWLTLAKIIRYDNM